MLRTAMAGPFRFNVLLRQLPDSNRLTLTNALRQMDTDGQLLQAEVRREPLRMEYVFTPSDSAGAAAGHGVGTDRENSWACSIEHAVYCTITGVRCSPVGATSLSM